MAYTPDELADLSTIHGDADSNQFADIDPLGGAIFGWGNRAWNNEIERKNAKLAKMKAALGAERFEAIRNTIGDNEAAWDQLGTEIFGEDGNKLDDFYAGAQSKDSNALNDLLGGLGNFENAADFFYNPKFMGDVGDVEGYQGPSAGTLASQQNALGQFKELSNPNETAQEKLMRLMAQREMEANMRGDREAMERSLKARGTYGSGAELTSGLMSQAEQANRRSMANLAADANASKRAMDALGSYADLSGKMRASEAQEGGLAQAAAQFNNATNQNLSNQRAQGQVAATQAGETAKQQRAVQGFNATRGVTDATRNDTQATNTAKTNFTQGSTGNRTQNTGMFSDAVSNEMSEIDKLRAANAAKNKTSLLGVG